MECMHAPLTLPPSEPRTARPEIPTCADENADADFGGPQLGIFLCMRCATIHRKLGTHVSKVKSLSMDSWTNEQVDVCTDWLPR